VLVTALLDGLLYRYEVVKLTKGSYRIEYRENIFLVVCFFTKTGELLLRKIDESKFAIYSLIRF